MLTVVEIKFATPDLISLAPSQPEECIKGSPGGTQAPKCWPMVLGRCTKPLVGLDSEIGKRGCPRKSVIFSVSRRKYQYFRFC